MFVEQLFTGFSPKAKCGAMFLALSHNEVKGISAELIRLRE
jgi:hypothetical protein